MTDLIVYSSNFLLSQSVELQGWGGGRCRTRQGMWKCSCMKSQLLHTQEGIKWNKLQTTIDESMNSQTGHKIISSLFITSKQDVSWTGGCPNLPSCDEYEMTHCLKFLGGKVEVNKGSLNWLCFLFYRRQEFIVSNNGAILYKTINRTITR